MCLCRLHSWVRNIPTVWSIFILTNTENQFSRGWFCKRLKIILLETIAVKRSVFVLYLFVRYNLSNHDGFWCNCMCTTPHGMVRVFLVEILYAKFWPRRRASLMYLITTRECFTTFFLSFYSSIYIVLVLLSLKYEKSLASPLRQSTNTYVILHRTRNRKKGNDATISVRQ